MNALQGCRTLAIALAGFALTTGVHAAAPAQPPAPTHPAATAAGANAGTAARTAKSHKATAKMKTRQATPPGAASAEKAASGDSAYRAALRQCVAGPAAQREACIDEAIARYGRG